MEGKIVPISINRLDTHDRFQEFVKQDFSINECVQDLIDKKPFGNWPFYIFAHSRTEDDAITKRLIWQPRLTKPSAQTNSMLFKVYPGTDVVHVIWMIPSRELWPQYKKGNVTENALIAESIHKFINKREALEAPEKDDLDDATISAIYAEISNGANQDRLMKRQYPKPNS